MSFLTPRRKRLKVFDKVGPVIAALMHVGDIISLNCERLYCCDNAQRKIHELSASYLIDCKQKEIESPAVIQVPGVGTYLEVAAIIE